MCLNSITNNMQKVNPEFVKLEMKQLIKESAGNLPEAWISPTAGKAFARMSLRSRYLKLEKTVLDTLSDMADIMDQIVDLDDQEVA